MDFCVCRRKEGFFSVSFVCSYFNRPLKPLCERMTLGDSVLVHLRDATIDCEEPICANRFSCIEDVCFTSRFSSLMILKTCFLLLIEP